MLWIPGPTYVRPEILAECARPAIGHRSREMTDAIERLDPGLALAFGLQPSSSSSVAVHSVSATAMMEAALHGVGERVLCVVNGAFSRRWADIAGIIGKQVTVLELEWGQAPSRTDLERVLGSTDRFDAVTALASETSTGTATCLSEVRDVLADFGAPLLLSDLVSFIAGARVDFDVSGIDFAFAGVQKAFALPPGISVLCASERYLEAARARKRPSFTLDPVAVIEGHAQRKTPATPCIPLYFALARQLEDISSGVTLPEDERHLNGPAAWQARFDKHSRMQTQTLAWADRHGLRTLPDRIHSSPTVTCLRAGTWPVENLIHGLAERGLMISNGYGKLRNRAFRIGHMGDHTEEGLTHLLGQADEVISDMTA